MGRQGRRISCYFAMGPLSFLPFPRSLRSLRNCHPCTLTAKNSEIRFFSAKIWQKKNGTITLRNQQVILDCDVAELYGAATKEINQAVRNNPEKFPEGYIFKIDNQEINGAD